MDLKKISSGFGLTRRETDVLRYMLRGLKNVDIAGNLEIAEQTVKEHLSSIYRKIGVENRFELMHSLIKTSNEKLTALSKNITELKRIEKELRGALLADELTGLYNRRGFLALAEHHMRIAKRQKNTIYILFANVENLKAINDTFGRDKGDIALREAANILKDTFRESDVIARIGSDEFAVIPLGTSQADADRVVARLEKNLELFNLNRNNEYHLSVSYGISRCDPDGHCIIDELLPRADKSMCSQEKKIIA